jgi:hypothetical protein
VINHAIGLSKDELIRKLMLGKMQRSEYTNGRNEEIKAWVAKGSMMSQHFLRPFGLRTGIRTRYAVFRMPIVRHR